jgi:hypothetical protein
MNPQSIPENSGSSLGIQYIFTVGYSIVALGFLTMLIYAGVTRITAAGGR